MIYDKINMKKPLRMQSNAKLEYSEYFKSVRNASEKSLKYLYTAPVPLRRVNSPRVAISKKEPKTDKSPTLNFKKLHQVKVYH